MKSNLIMLGHGSGGAMSHELIQHVFVKYFSNPELNIMGDSAVFATDQGYMAFTTDTFVVSPLFFPGGDIGKLAVAGTVNDLAVAGAIPKYLSTGFVIEEGFPVSLLEKIVISMSDEAAKAGISIVTGDTKVVAKGQCDQIYINTSGIGLVRQEAYQLTHGNRILPGDKIIINGSIADHGMAIMSARNQLQIKAPILSDCASLNDLIHQAFQVGGIHFMRDPTRGGLATTAVEIAENQDFGIELYEQDIAVNDGVRGICEILGFDPLYVANEGKVVLIVAAEKADLMLATLKKHALGKESTIIGEITASHPGRVWLQTVIGGARIIDRITGELLPRIC